MDIKADVVSSWQSILENEVGIDIYTDCWKGSVISGWLFWWDISEFCTELFTELHHWTFVCFLLASVQWIGLKSPLLACQKLQLHFHHIDAQSFGHSPNIQKALGVKSFIFLEVLAQLSWGKKGGGQDCSHSDLMTSGTDWADYATAPWLGRFCCGYFFCFILINRSSHLAFKKTP